MAYPYGGNMQMPMPNAYNSSGQMQYPASSVASSVPYPTTSLPPSYGTASATTHQTTTTEIDRWMAEAISQLSLLLKDAPKAELDQLVENEDKIIELVETSEQIKQLQRKRESIIEENKDQAVANMSLRPDVESRKNELVTLATRQNELKERHTQLQNKLAGTISLDSISAILQASVSEAEEESDKISQDFLDGSIPLEDFLDEYISKRTIYQLRQVKSNKMAQILQTGTASVSGPSPYPRPASAARLSPMPRPAPIPRPTAGGYGGYNSYYGQ